MIIAALAHRQGAFAVAEVLPRKLLTKTTNLSQQFCIYAASSGIFPIFVTPLAGQSDAFKVL